MKLVALRSKLARKEVQTASALAICLAISFMLFGMPLVGHFAHRFIGDRVDPLTQIWALAWWPHALASRVNPVFPRVIWPPTGYNLAWAASMPGPSLLLYPITRSLGPIVSYNILCLFCPAAAAFSTFVLCRYVSGKFWPSLLGGYIFGFSQYVLAHMPGHLFLLFIFPVPLAVYLALLRLGRRISRATFLTLLVLVLTFEFLSSTELFATTAVFAGLALALSYLIYEEQFSAGILRIAVEIACAYMVTTLLLAPYLYCVFARGLPAPINSSSVYSNDLLAFAIPTLVFYVGRVFRPIVARFGSGPVETAAYLGPGLWIILVLYTESYWSTRRGKFLIFTLVLIGVMSLGPVLHIDGKEIGSAPWWLFSKLPLIDQALPNRFGMYFFLVAAVLTSLYLSETAIPTWSKIVLSGLCLLSLTPNLSRFRLSAVTHVDIPHFFKFQEYKRYLAHGDNVLVLPYVEREDGLLWQVQTDFYFRLAVARLEHAPPEFSAWPVLSTLYSGDETMDFPRQLNAFLGAHQVKAIIVDSRDNGPWKRLISDSGLSPLEIGGVLFYKVPPRVLASFRNATAHEMAHEQAARSFSALIIAASQYLAAGHPLVKLNPWEAQRLKLLALPQTDTRPVSANPQWWQNLWLGPWDDSMVGIGMVGDYEVLRPLVQQYGPDAAEIFFPFPAKLADGPKQAKGQLLIIFTPLGLERAASKAKNAGEGSGLAPDDRPRFLLQPRFLHAQSLPVIGSKFVRPYVKARNEQFMQPQLARRNATNSLSARSGVAYIPLRHANPNHK